MYAVEDVKERVSEHSARQRGEPGSKEVDEPGPEVKVPHPHLELAANAVLLRVCHVFEHL